ncbi:hypothetical protein QN277_028804 [Acacia crassicarpa]|uniref:Chaperone DnaJ C-terminal domain-containing protein n=1 Tax=Acacia crassicarpa TaxID=499986 RepID=A0AAE1J6G0_9FABA|nr:hypothetical protein QN277_028804 [Acacia crassicarpa]
MNPATCSSGNYEYNKLPLSLEELYKGCIIKFRNSRTVFDYRGTTNTVEEILKIEVEPGWKKDTVITFPGKGNQVRRKSAATDLVIVVEEKPHPIFKREQNDLIITHKISLLEALTGKTIKVTMLDGREIEVSVTDIVKPDTEIVVQDEGMPSASKPGKKGNLRINFDIIFPSQLSTLQKCQLKKIFSEVDSYS